MSMYHLINGVNPATFLILPMLGKHPDEYPRFRDCFIADEDHPEFDGKIQVYTRTGGENRETYRAENAEMEQTEGFITTFDDNFDSTYASWVFEVPERWRADFDTITNRKEVKAVSKEYQAELRRVYPKLEEKWYLLFGEQE